ncbi:MAG: helicase-related protein [Candidatus Peregrinibacteria bacterium]
MSSDLTFITNEQGKSLKERFKVLVKDTRLFDVLVGYFYTSGFHAVYKSLEKTEKIRILIGISTNRQTYNLVEQSKQPEQTSIEFSHAEAKEEFEKRMVHEMEWEAKDTVTVEEGVHTFMKWLRSGKLEIRAYPSQKIHAKLYIMTFPEGDRDAGRVITGSSNFTQSGLVENLEFNVELKMRADYEYARKKFEELWKDSVDMSEKYIETIQNKTWLNDTITPREMFLKFLYEYFKDEINRPVELFYQYVPTEFKQLEYQEQAVLNAKKILDEYGGVFLSDVVGLGKTYMAAMLAQQLDGRSLVLASPVLLDADNPGSWTNVFSDFRVSATFESIGVLEKLLERGTDQYKNVFIDEAHHFRTDTNITYEMLARICRGKRVILVSATPYNNYPRDILNQIKLFQKGKSSTIPNMPNLDAFFAMLERKRKNLDRQKDYEEFMRVTKENAKEVREKVLKYLMVRRTRSEIIKYFGEDLAKQKLRFPDVADPEAVFYEFNSEEDKVFSRTIEIIAREFSYARYMPLSSKYYKGDLQGSEEQAQVNMGKFMKILLIKRLESSFFAFRNTVARFIHSYERFLEEYEKGSVYVSRKHSLKLFDLLERDDDAAVDRLMEQDKAQKYDAKDFKKEFESDLRSDLAALREIEKLWKGIVRDPKLIAFAEILTSRPLLKDNKLIVFTESKETAEYLAESLNERLGNVLCYTGSSDASVREQVIKNFDAKVKNPKDDYRILIATEVLAEGVNLHRSNVVINYDIPWNPTRVMQRVGRINRVDTKFPKIYTFNFFPTKQSNDQIKLRESAESKIHAFIEMLGADARLLTDGEEIKSHDLFVRLSSKQTITGEGEGVESELKYLSIIRDLRDNEPDIFEHIKRLPKKARTARASTELRDSLLTYFRKGKLQKFFLAGAKNAARELDFLAAASYLEAEKNVKREELGKRYYEYLEQNKEAFRFATNEEVEMMETQGRTGADKGTRLLKILRASDIRRFKGYTEDDEVYLERVIREVQDGGMPKQTLKEVMKLIEKEMEGGIHPLKILGALRTCIPEEFFKESLVSSAAKTAGPREVILSEYFKA